ncbi:MAG: HEAT repeat domain-containing protein [Nitrospirota bacterium]|nr:MAG: HEAT repeat domain-containing protein [Nitrospirota bacterium]
MKNDFRQSGQVNILAALVIIALVVGGIWVWNHLSFDTQDLIVEDILPIVLLVMLAGVGIWLMVRKFKLRRHMLEQRERLINRFKQESSAQKRVDVAFTLVELNRYELEGLEAIAEPMAELFVWKLKTALGDKQHRIRGMAASYLGILQHQPAIPLLIQALEDDHAHVRASAALALGRMRIAEAKSKLESLMKDDWDQTVRSRAREALERIK